MTLAYYRKWKWRRKNSRSLGREGSLQCCCRIVGGATWACKSEYLLSILVEYTSACVNLCHRNPGIPTIEEDLITALRKALAFPECMENDHKKVRNCCVHVVDITRSNYSCNLKAVLVLTRVFRQHGNWSL